MQLIMRGIRKFWMLGLVGVFTGFTEELPPGTVTLHVAAEAVADDADGSVAHPFTGLAQALPAATPYLQVGTPVRLLFAPGVYREGGLEWTGHDFGTVAQQTPLILEGAELDRVVFSGAEVWEGGWSELSPGHWTRVWPYVWGYGPDPWVAWNYHLPPEMRRREMLVVDGERVLPVFAIEDLAEQRFFVDEAAGVIHYMGENPNTRLVEVPVEHFWLSMRGKSNLTVRRITVRHYSNFIDEIPAARFWGFGPGGLPGSSNILLEDCRFDDNSAQGLSVGLYDIGTVRRVRLRGNGYLNASFPTNHNLLVEDVETTGANWRGYPHGELSWSAGGIKATRAQGSVYRRVVAADNLANGLWFDVYCGANTVEELHAFGQENYGLYFELSDGPLVLDGGYFGNNSTAMVLAETRDMEVRNVEAVSNRTAVVLRENGRGIPLERLVFTDNRLANHRQGDLLFNRTHSVSDADMAALAPGFDIRRNRYAHAFPQQAFRIPGLTNLSGWQNFLQGYPAITGKDEDAAVAVLDTTGSVNGPVVWEIWENLPDATLAALRDLPDFQSNLADGVERRWLTEDVWGREGAYGQRGAGRLRAPVTGMYQFRLSADRQAELWLGLDGPLSTPELVLSVSTPTDRRSASGPIYSVTLAAGQIVPFQILHAGLGGSEGEGHVSLLWSRPDRAEFHPLSSVHILQPRIRVEALVGSTVMGSGVPAILRVHRDPPLNHPLEVMFERIGAAEADLGAEMPLRIPAGMAYVDIPVSAEAGALSGHQTLTLRLLDGDFAKVKAGEGLATVHLLDPLYSAVPVFAEDFEGLNAGDAILAGNTEFTHSRVDAGVNLTATADTQDDFEQGADNVFARFVDNHSSDLLQLGYDHGEGVDHVVTLAFDLVDRSVNPTGNYFAIRLSTAHNPQDSFNYMIALRRDGGERFMTTTGTSAQQFPLPAEDLLRVRVIVNNSSETVFEYTEGQSLAPGKMDVWVNGELLGNHLNPTVWIGGMGHDGQAIRSLAFLTFGMTVNVDVGVDNVRLYAGAVMADAGAGPPSLTLEETEPGTLSAAWSGWPAADSYELSFRRAGASFWTRAAVSLDAETIEMDLPGLAANEFYEVRIRGFVAGELIGEILQTAHTQYSGEPVQEGLAGWRQHFFGTSLSYGDAADEADPDGDGVSNFLEYAFGSNPLDAASRPGTRIQPGDTPASMTLEYERPLPPHTLTYHVEQTDNLAVSWENVPEEHLQIAVEELEETERVRVTVALPEAPAIRFYRISVE